MAPAAPGLAPPIHEPAAPAGTSGMLGSKPLFSFRRLGKLMGFGIASAVPGFLTSGFLPPENPARTPAMSPRFHSQIHQRSKLRMIA